MASNTQPSVQAFLIDFVSGALSAAVSKTLSAPIERVKLLQQVQSDLISSGRLARPYTGTIDCFLQIVKHEGISALFLGNLANVVRYFPTQALNFACKDIIKALVVPDRRTSGFLLYFIGNIMSGGLAGAASLLFVYPLDYARTRLACQLPDRDGDYQFEGTLDCMVKVIKEQGVGGLYRGFVISCVGIVLYRGAYFGLYDTLRPLLHKSRSLRNNWIASFVFAWGVTIVAGLVTYPVDTIRRRMMMHSADEPGFSSTLSTISTIYNQDGISGFFAGAATNTARAILGAAVLAAYDAAAPYLKSVLA